ncbi:MAG: dihydropyrimidinase [Bacteroidales bacterium]|nr:dihydropyrimidinase [Bacteroidales bacterium]
MKTIIRNGTIVTDKQTYPADILIEKGTISRIVENLPSEPGSAQEIDAKACYVLPGGIDPHVHMHLPAPAGFSSDDFLSGSRAALIGGTTTIIDFVTPMRGQSITEALDIRKKEAGSALTDIMFHVSPVEFTENTEKELEQCIEMGIRSFKVYMAYKSNIGLNDDDLLKVLKIVGKANGIVAVHCETGDEIEVLRNKYFEQGKIEPKYHALSRPPETEARAVRKLLEMAKEAGCAVYLVHISSALSLEHIRKAREAGQEVFAETCPQYLLLDDSLYEGDFSQTAKFVMSPPLRKKTDNEALWKALSEGLIQSVGTDHCPFTLAQKKAGLNNFRKIPNGAGGVEHRLALLYTYGVLENRITLQQFVNLTAAMPAKIFGLYPRKAAIAVGSDADLVIWNPNTKNIISASSHHQHCDLNIYDGFKTTGSPEYVIKGGEIAARKGEIKVQNPGCYLANPARRGF